MASVLFFEKPGCVNNTRQKALLAASGHSVWARNLLAEKWTRQRLRAFFGELPVAQWFNPAAPRVQSGEVRPERLDEEQALALMLLDPLLIRRPLMEVDGECRAGFDAFEVDRWIGLAEGVRQDMESCPRPHAAEACAEPRG